METTIKSRSLYVHSQVMKLLGELAEKCYREGWDGRELAIGVAVTYRAICEATNVDYQRAMDLVKRIDPPPAPETREVSSLIAPNGRPIGMVPK